MSQRGAYLLLLIAVACGSTAGFSAPVSAQSISGIVNRYQHVVAIDECRNTIVVDTAKIFAPGDRVLIIQMRGATIDQSNTSAYGSVVSFGAAGLCEIAEVKGIPNAVTIRFKNKLLNHYDPRGLVQIVRIPQYGDATVAAPLTAEPWNAQLGRGGIIMIEASGTLTLESDIDVSGLGFAGGGKNQNGGVPSAGYAMPDTGTGGLKGEGIGTSNIMLVAGRGAPANGGGGGDSHNSGGGGGANLTDGGQGGDQTSGESGFKRLAVGGVGGHGLIADSGKALLLGGGGGGGHENNGQGTAGASGGGIVIIRAKAINGVGGTIRSNGASVPAASNIDGAGGGGAGGTVVLDVGNVTGSLKVQVLGGNGGNANTDGAFGFGPGGGGSGGAVYGGFAPALPIQANGGNPGLLVGCSDPSIENTSYGATAGKDGSKLPPFTLQEGADKYEYPIVLRDTVSICAGDSGVIGSTRADSYTWSGGTFANPADSQQVVSPAATTTYYVTTTKGACQFFDSVTVSVLPKPSSNFNGPLTVCTGSTVTYSVHPDTGVIHSWTVVGGTPASATGDSVVVTWVDSGTGHITLTASGPCASSTTRDIAVGKSVTPLILGLPAICFGTLDTLKSDAVYATYRWSTGDTTPTIIVSNAGNYTLTVTTSGGCQGQSVPISIVALSQPVVKIMADSVQLAKAGDSVTLHVAAMFNKYYWSAGTDSLGSSDSLIVGTAGTYRVLVADTNGCEAIDSITITIAQAMPDVMLGLPDLAAAPGDHVVVPINIIASYRLDSSGATQFTCTLRFNRSLLEPDDAWPSVDAGRDRIITISGNRSDALTSGALIQVGFTVALGDTEETVLHLDSLVWTNGKPVTTSLSNGTFKLLGICTQGGKRLFSADGYFGITSMAPNPAGGSLSIDYRLIEPGITTLRIVDMLGRNVLTVLAGESEPGLYHATIDVSSLQSGIYTIILQSPTQREFRKLEVYR